MMKYVLRMSSFSFVCYILQSLHELDNYLVSEGIWGSLNFIHIMSRGHCYYHLGNSLKRASYGQFSSEIVHFLALLTYVCFLDIFDEIYSEELLFIAFVVSTLLTELVATKGHSFTEFVLWCFSIAVCIIENNFMSKRKHYHALLTAGATKGQSFRESVIESSTYLLSVGEALIVNNLHFHICLIIVMIHMPEYMRL